MTRILVVEDNEAILRGLRDTLHSRPVYPELFRSVQVYGRSFDEILWKGDPREWPEGEVLRIELEPAAGEPAVTVLVP